MQASHATDLLCGENYMQESSEASRPKVTDGHIYFELFGAVQRKGTSADHFVYKKYALLVQIVTPLPSEVQLVMVYTLPLREK